MSDGPRCATSTLVMVSVAISARAVSGGGHGRETEPARRRPQPPPGATRTAGLHAPQPCFQPPNHIHGHRRRVAAGGEDPPRFPFAVVANAPTPSRATTPNLPPAPLPPSRSPPHPPDLHCDARRRRSRSTSRAHPGVARQSPTSTRTCIHQAHQLAQAHSPPASPGPFTTASPGPLTCAPQALPARASRHRLGRHPRRQPNHPVRAREPHTGCVPTPNPAPAPRALLARPPDHRQERPVPPANTDKEGGRKGGLREERGVDGEKRPPWVLQPPEERIFVRKQRNAGADTGARVSL